MVSKVKKVKKTTPMKMKKVVKAVVKKSAPAKKSAAVKNASRKLVAKIVAKPVSKKPVVKVVAKPAPKVVAKPIHKVAAGKVPAKLPAKPAKKSKMVEVEAPELVLKTPFNAKELDFYKGLLLKIRDQLIDGISFLANDNLNRSQRDSAGDLSSYSFHMADQGTDNFDRELAANLLNGEQDVLYEIDEALRRIEQKTYGVCEMSGKPIEKERLKVLPHCRYCVSVQSEMEKGKPHFRPFKRTSIQQAVEPSSGD